MSTFIVHKPKRSAFTLVELLIVVGIVAILVAMLLPALNKAIDSARSVACLSNMRQLAAANFNYAADERGYNLPSAYWNAAGGHDTWEAILMYKGYIPSSTRIYGYTGNYWWHIVHSDILRCPAGNDLDQFYSPPWAPDPVSPVDSAGLLPHLSYYYLPGGLVNYFTESWYGCNSMSDDSSSSVAGVNGTQYWPMHSFPTTVNLGAPTYANVASMYNLPKISSVSKASEVVFIRDGSNGAIPGGNGYPNAARHAKGTRCNVAFFDGHAESLPCSTTPSKNVFPLPPTYFPGWSASALNGAHAFPKWRLDQ